MFVTTTDLAQRTRENTAKFIADGRRFYMDQIYQIACQLRDHREQAPIVLLAGPSGSGKTTTALLLARQLRQFGVEAHAMCMDNYFSPLSEEEKELMAQHKLDLESPNRVDKEFLNQQLRDIMDGKTVLLPRYDFASSCRVFDGDTITRRPNEMFIVEGIHALNPALTGELGDFTARIYVSIRTRIHTADGTELHPAKIRLTRRMLRDTLTRGRPLEAIVRMAPSVDAGEHKYILPFKHTADYEVNSFIPYEMSVYTTALLPRLQKEQEQLPQLREIVKVMSELEPIALENVPKDSVIREFIGGIELEK